MLAIASKSKEARRTMSFDSFALLARVAGPAALMDILDPLKEMMKTTVTMKVCHGHLTSLSSACSCPLVKSCKTCISLPLTRQHSKHLEEIFRNIGHGINSNSSMTVEHQLRFIHG